MQGIDLTPKKYERNRKSFRDLHADWQFMDWNEDDMRKLAKGTKWEDALKMTRKMIQRADVLRCVVLEKFGGVYADMDMYCIQNLDSFLEIDNVQAGATSFHNTALKNIMGGVNNGILFSPPGHKFWQETFLPEILRRLQTHTLLDDLCPAVNIIRTAGPQVWTSFRDIKIHPQVFFYSLVILKKTVLNDDDVKTLKGAGAFVYHAQDSVWLNSWEKYLVGAFEGRAWMVSVPLVVVPLLVLFVWFLLKYFSPYKK